MIKSRKWLINSKQTSQTDIVLNMKHILSILLGLTIAISVSAQPFHTQAKACVTDEGVALRWAPTDMQSWQAGLSNGYIIERFTIMKDNCYLL